MGYFFEDIRKTAAHSSEDAKAQYNPEGHFVFCNHNWLSHEDDVDFI